MINPAMRGEVARGHAFVDGESLRKPTWRNLQKSIPLIFFDGSMGMILTNPFAYRPGFLINSLTMNP
jgi:hypothetical protein